MKRFYLLALCLTCLISVSYSSTVYFINSDGWTTVNAYVWGDSGNKADWPGEAMTKTAQQINGFDVYSYDVDETIYPNIIFTNKKEGSNQTEDLTVQPGKYYYWKDKTWYATADAVPALDDNPSVVIDPMNEAYWNFDQEDLKNLGTINGNVIVRGLTLVGGDNKMKVESVGPATLGDSTYTYMLNFDGTSRDGYREVVIPTKKNTKIELWVYKKTNSERIFSLQKNAFGGETLADLKCSVKEKIVDHLEYNHVGEDANIWLSVSSDKCYLCAIRLTPYVNENATGIYLAGAFNEWATDALEFNKLADDNTKASVTLSLAKATEYEFKIVDNGTWLGNNGTITTDITGWAFSSSEGNCKLQTAAAGEYLFTLDLATKALSVAYPPEKSYWLKHPFGGGSWEWKPLELQSDFTYTLTDIWGNNGVNIADNEAGDNSDWIEKSQIQNASLAKTGATVTFVYDPDTKQVSLTNIKNPENYVEEYYIKHPWGGGSWEWQKLELQADSTWTYRGVWGDNGVNIADNAAGNDADWITKKDIVNYELAELGDTVTFVYYPKENKVTITDVPDHGEPPTPEVSYYIKHGWADGQDASWTWQPMVKQDNGDWTYRGIWGGTGVDINTEPEDKGDNKQYFETVQGSQALQLGDSALFIYMPTTNSVSVELISTHSALYDIHINTYDEESYNLFGQKVDADYKGIIIRKGKKYISLK